MQLPDLAAQARRLDELGLLAAAGVSAREVSDAVAAVDGADPGSSLLVVAEERAPVSTLAPLVQREGRSGFVVEDMTDVDEFRPVDGIEPPAGAVYVVRDVDRGDEMRNWSPDEAAVAIERAGRTPLLLVEGLHWLLQAPAVLAPNHCFMTVGSRLRRPDGRLDARTPALWISGGTGRDGKARRGAPKVGWCWAGNRHTWLGFASAGARVGLPEVAVVGASRR